MFGGFVFLVVILTLAYPQKDRIFDLFSNSSSTPNENSIIALEPIDTNEALLQRGFTLNSDDSFFIPRENDRDNDGLLDWEEALWQTNPDNSDTDGDGTIDGVEVERDRNPLVPGPSDLIVSGSNADFLLAQRDSGPQPGNLSDQLSQGLFTTYVDGQEGRTTVQQQAEDIVGLAQNAVSGVAYQDYYTQDSFPTSSASDLVALKTYANNLALAQGNLLSNLFDATGAATGRAEFVSNIYRNHARSLGEFTVPDTLVATHTKLANDYANLAANLYNVEEFDLDPAKAIFSLQQYDILRVEVEETMSVFPPFFRNNGIVFSDNEPGALWNQI